MSNRLDQERETKLQPQRIEFAKNELTKLGLNILVCDNTKIVFKFKDNNITYYPYSGWASGKGIQQGRGWGHLFWQLTKQ